jgi:N-methylhydantoinase A
MVAFGGAGPVHAAALAKELNIPHVIIPPGPGVFSAFGMMVTDVRADYSKTVILSIYDPNARMIIDLELKKLIKKAKADLKNTSGRPTFVTTLDMRYKGQSYEINIEYKNNITKLLNTFHETHNQRFGYCSLDREVEIVNVRLVSIIHRKKPEILRSRKKARKPTGINKKQVHGYREILFDREKERVTTPIYHRADLRPGSHGKGPAVIQEPSSTVAIYPGMKFEIDKFSIIHIKT